MNLDHNIRCRVLGVPIDAINMSEALDFVADAVKERTAPGFIFAVNPEKVYALRRDPELAAVFEKAALLIPDGIGVVKAIRFLTGKKIERVAGADLMQNICAEAPRRGYRIFIYGSSRETNCGACRILRERCPGIEIVGNSDGFVSEADMPTLIEAINRSKADILFVALGSPRQERWLVAHCGELETVRLCMGIGGTLDTITGCVKRAPAVFRNCGLEWFYRLLKQPSRIGRQVNLLRFMRDVALAKFGWRVKA